MPDTSRPGKGERELAEEPARVPRVPTPEDIEIVGLIPLLAPFFRRSLVQDITPEPLRGTMESHGMTARHGAVLAQLLAGQPLTVTELARRMQVSVPTASELVGALSRAGIVRREEDPANRRRILVTLAEEYRPAFERFVTARSETLLRALDGLSARDRAGFLAGLTAWVTELQR
ncbi:MarR family transcriptional regulator [Streptomyces sp. MST-110588]|uniref:MarR family winged helix-turn-helix transcriptional regulator n=1 Tax=Streptomyces sp. MST-110588 TaxID=2833628 RepID=UPI001F5E2846|nr:MarR family transcriptional regulator [Streptomyces sp. MST-110588]UNO38507.1 MarR family transcriptional regulator [Streptomyces sp. MST-110588]